MNGQPIVNESRTTRASTKVNGGAAVGGMNGSSNLVNVDLPRNYTDDNSNAIGGDVSPIVFISLGGGGNGDITQSLVSNYWGFAACNVDGLSVDVGDAIKFDGTTPYSGVYRVLAVSGAYHCVFNETYTATTGQISSIYKQSGIIDRQTGPYSTVGRQGNRMERDRIHQVQKLVTDNKPSLIRSGHYNFATKEFLAPIVYSDKWPSFKVSGNPDKTTVNYGLSVGGEYAFHLAKKGSVKKGCHMGKNESGTIS